MKNSKIILCMIAVVFVIVFTASNENLSMFKTSDKEPDNNQHARTLTGGPIGSSGVFISENFESYTDGSDLIGQGSWIANTTYHPICKLITHPTTKVGRFNSTDGNARGAFWTLPGTMASGSTWNSVTFIARPSSTIQRFYPWMWYGSNKVSVAGFVAFWDNGTIELTGASAKVYALQPYTASKWYLITFYIRLSDCKMFCTINGTTYMNGGNYYSPYSVITPAYARVICTGSGFGDIDNITCSWMQLQPTATFTVGGPTLPTIGQNVTFTHTGSNGNAPATYQWNFGDNSTNATTENTGHTYSAGGNFLIKFYIRDVDGDSAFSATNITIYTQTEPFDEYSSGTLLNGTGGWNTPTVLNNSAVYTGATVVTGSGLNKYANLSDSNTTQELESDWSLPDCTGSGSMLPSGWQWMAFSGLSTLYKTGLPTMTYALRNWFLNKTAWQVQFYTNDTFMFNNRTSTSFTYGANTWYYFKVYFNTAKHLCWMQYTTSGASSWTTCNNSNAGYPYLFTCNPGKFSIMTGKSPTGDGKCDNISCSWMQPLPGYYVENFNNWANGATISGEAIGEHVTWAQQLGNVGSYFKGFYLPALGDGGDCGVLYGSTLSTIVESGMFDTPSPLMPSPINEYWTRIDLAINGTAAVQVALDQTVGLTATPVIWISFNTNGSLTYFNSTGKERATGLLWTAKSKYSLVIQCLGPITSRFSLNGGITWSSACPNYATFTTTIKRIYFYSNAILTTTSSTFMDNLATSWTQSSLSANFTWAPASPTNGTAVAFTHTGNNGAGICTYQWNFTDPMSAANATTENPSHTFTNAGKYKVILFIQDCFGNTAKQTTIVKVMSVPSSPQLLVASNGLGKVMLSWQAPTSNGQSAITNYNIYRGTASTMEILYTIVSNVTSYNDSIVTQGLTYYYKVSAVNSIGESAKSNEVKIPVLLSSDQIGDQWPMFHGALNHTGVVTTPPVQGTAITWAYSTGSIVQSSSAVAGGRVFFGSNDNKFYCLNATSGAFLWSYYLGTNSYIYSSPAVADGRVYVGSYNDQVYCFNATTTNPSGQLLWSYPTGGSVYSSPAIVNGRVYVGSQDDKVYCLNATSGSFMWSYTTGGSIYYSSPAVVSGRVYVGSEDNKVYCLDATTTNSSGHLLWSYTTGGYVISSPAVVNGRVYVGSYDKYVYCLDATSGAFIWSYLTVTGNYVMSSPAVVNGRVYVGCENNKVYCLNATNGSKIWSYTTSGQVEGSSPAVSNGRVYIGCDDDNLYCLNATNGALAWCYTTGSPVFASPAIASGHVYFGSTNDHKEYCLPMVITPSVPSAPQSFAATAGNRSVTLNWAAPASNGYSLITGYKVYRGTTSGGETLVATLGVTLTYTATILTNGQTYYFKVAAVNSAGTGANSTEASATPATVPGAPTGLTAVPQTSQVLLNWTAPASNGGSLITNYKIFVGTAPGGEKLNATVVSVLMYNVTNLHNGQVYYFKVAAVNAMGTGANSTEVSAIPALLPGAPTGLAATSQITQVTLNWVAPASNGGSAITGYKIYQGTSLGGETLLATIGNVTKYTSMGLTNNQIYYFKVAAINPIGTGANSTETSATPRPADISITQVQDGTGRGIYVEGETFLVLVYYSNTGGTDANVTPALTTFTYSSAFTFVAPSVFVLKAGTSMNKTFSVTIKSGAPNVAVTFDPKSSCKENISGRIFNSIGPASNLTVSIQGKANLIIANVVEVTIRTPKIYIGGETFQVRVNFQNTGGTDATSVMASLVFNSTYLSVTAYPGSILLPAFSTNYQLFTLAVNSSTININVAINATASGYEKYTSRTLSASTTSLNNLKIAVQAPSSVIITNMGITIRYPRSPTTYIASETFQIQVKYRNTGSTAALNIVTTLNYNGYLYLNANSSASITVPAGGRTASVYFNITVSATATNQYPVLIDALFTGMEQYSNRTLNGVSNSSSELTGLGIQSQTSLSITSIQDISAQGTYVGGQTFKIRVNYQNTGGTAAKNVNTTLSFNGYAYITRNASRLIIVPAGGTNQTYFLITVLSNATSKNSVVIDASFTGREEYSNRMLSGATTSTNDLNVAIQACANVTIMSIVSRSGAGPFVGGMTFVIRVNYRNSGGTAAILLTTTLMYGSYGGLNGNMTAYIVVPAANGTAYNDFLITVAAGVITQNPVTINATWGAFEAITGRPIGGNAGTHVLNVAIQSQAIVSIASITDQTGLGHYVGGMTFVIRVTYQNTGGTSTNNNVQTTVTFGGHSGLTRNTTASITVAASGTAYNDFLITVANGVTTAVVTINANWTGTEAISNRLLSGNAGTHTLNVNIQSMANPFLASVVANVTQQAPSKWVLITVNVRNNGGTAVNSGSVVLSFNSSYVVLPTIEVNASTGLTLPAGGYVGVQIKFQINSVAPNGANIGINATFTGNEAISNRVVTCYAAALAAIKVNTGSIVISLNIPIGRTIYVRGESFVARVTIDNTLGILTTLPALSLDFGSATGFSSNTSAPISTPLGMIIITRDFLVNTTTGAAASCNMRAHFTSTIPLYDIWSNTIVITTQAPASVAITSIALRTGTSPFVGGQTFTVRVNYTNSGGTAANAIQTMLMYVSYSGLMGNVTGSITVAASSIAYQDFLINVLTGATTQNPVTINANWTGTETISSRSLSGNAGTNMLSVAIQAQANLSITSIVYTSGNGTYVEPHSFTVRVFYNNTGGTSALNANSVLSFNGYSSLTSNTSASITVLAHGTGHQDFNVTIVSGAQNQLVSISASASGTEDKSNRALSAISTSDLKVTIQGMAMITIEDLQDITGLSRYVQGMHFTVRVYVSNTGGTDLQNVNVMLKFNATGYTASSITPVNLPHDSTINISIVISIGNSAQVGSISINANATGTENITGDIISNLIGASSPLIKIVQAHESLSITMVVAITLQSYYIQGQSLLVDVMLNNSAGGTDVIQGVLGLIFNRTGYMSPQQTNLVIHSRQSIACQFNVTILSTAIVGKVQIDANFTGKEAYSNINVNIPNSNTPLVIICKTKANMKITEIVDSITTHKEGTSFLLNVTLENLGDAKAMQGNLSISFGSAENITAIPGSFGLLTSNGSSSVVYTFNVSIAIQATMGNITINLQYSGKEEITLRALSATKSNWTIVQSESNVVIEQVELYSGTSPFNQGTYFFVRVRLDNLGTVGVIKGNLTLLFNSSGYSSPSLQQNKNITGSQIMTFIFRVNINMNASYGFILVDAEFHALENITLDPVNVVGATTKLTIRVNLRPMALELGSVTFNSSAAVYQGQQNMILTFKVTNTGGAAATVSYESLAFTDPYSSQYTVVDYPSTNPLSLNAGQTVTYRFSIAVSATATANVLIVVFGEIYADDAYYGNTTHFLENVTSWKVNIPPRVQLSNAVFSHSDLAQGEHNVQLQLRIYVPGIYQATIFSIRFLFINGTKNCTSSFQYNTNTNLPFNQSAGSNNWIVYSINVSMNTILDTWLHLYVAIDASCKVGVHTFNLSAAMADTGHSIVVLTPAALHVLQVSVTVLNGNVLNATLGQTGLNITVYVQNVNETAATVSAVTLRVNTTVFSDYFTITTMPVITGASAVVNGHATRQYSFIVAITRDRSKNGIILIDARVFATGNYIGNNASSIFGADVPATLRLLLPGNISLLNLRFPGSNSITLGGTISIKVSIMNDGETSLRLDKLVIRAYLDGINVSEYVDIASYNIQSSSLQDISYRVMPGNTVILTLTITLETGAANSIKLRNGDILLFNITIKAEDENLNQALLGSSLISATISKDISSQIVDTFTDYWYLIILAGAGIVIAFGAIGVRQAKIKKATKAKGQQGKGKEYFAKQMAAPAEGKLAPLIGKEAPIGKSAKDAQAAATHEETRPQLTPEQLAEQRVTEAEVSTFKEKKICLVHKGPVSGNIYLCPQCDALYCVNCAQTLKKRGEKCWQCGSPIVVSDAAISEPQAPQEATQAMVPGAPAKVTIPGMQPAGTQPSRPAGPSFVVRNMARIDATLTTLGMPTDMKEKYLKEMNALPDADQARLFMDLEKEAYPDKASPVEISSMTSEIEDKLVHVQRALGDPATTVTEQDVAQYINQDFTTLDNDILDKVNALPWPKEKKLDFLKEMLALTPQERTTLLEDMFQQEDENE